MAYKHDTIMSKLIYRFLNGRLANDGFYLEVVHGHIPFKLMTEIDEYRKFHPEANGHVWTRDGYLVNEDNMREAERKEQAMISKIERQKIRELLHDVVDNCTFAPEEEVVVTDSGVELHLYCMPDRFTKIEIRIT